MIVACTWGEYVCTWFMWGSLLTCMYVGASHGSHKSHVTSQPNTIWTKSRVQVEFGVGWRFLDPNNISCALSRSRTAHFFIPNNVWTKYYLEWKNELFGNVITRVKCYLGPKNASQLQILLGPSISSRLYLVVTSHVTRVTHVMHQHTCTWAMSLI